LGADVIEEEAAEELIERLQGNGKPWTFAEIIAVIRALLDEIERKRNDIIELQDRL
jgi:hypothetical protein